MDHNSIDVQINLAGGIQASCHNFVAHSHPQKVCALRLHRLYNARILRAVSLCMHRVCTTLTAELFTVYPKWPLPGLPGLTAVLPARAQLTSVVFRCSCTADTVGDLQVIQPVQYVHHS